MCSFRDFTTGPHMQTPDIPSKGACTTGAVGTTVNIRSILFTILHAVSQLYPTCPVTSVMALRYRGAPLPFVVQAPLPSQAHMLPSCHARSTKLDNENALGLFNTALPCITLFEPFTVAVYAWCFGLVKTHPLMKKWSPMRFFANPKTFFEGGGGGGVGLRVQNVRSCVRLC